MTLIINDADVRRLLPMNECIEAMRAAFTDLATGVAVNRPRLRYLADHSDPTRKYLANVHVGAVPSYGVACVRAGSQILKPATSENNRRVYDNPSAFNWGVVILYSTETAEPLALMHEFHLSGARVGATIGLAVDRVTKKDASTLGLFGVGKQARCAFEAIVSVRPIRRVCAYSPNREHREAFALELSQGEIEVVAVDDPKTVVNGSDIVCCATSAMEPVFEGEWLKAGQFVISIANSDITNKRSEVDRRTFQRAAAIIVNDWESVVENSQTELLDLIEQEIVSRNKIYELGDILINKSTVDQSDDAFAQEIVYYKNNSGLAIQFAAAGAVIYRKALAEGICKSIPTEWLGSDLSAYYKAGFRPSP